ncbi:MAG: helix-turn-helix domain-containing protein [Chloroflexi bacterium]|nr:helix-turn-helix domain-containing protein [Chloroflexota bacterium]
MSNKPQKPSIDDEAFPDSLTRDMGKRIRRARDDSGMTQAELAEKIGRRQASVSHMENGKMEISAGTLARMASALEKPISYFFPTWLTKILQPEELAPDEQELLSLAQKLSTEDLQRFIIQIRAIVLRDERQYYEWLEEQEDRRGN